MNYQTELIKRLMRKIQGQGDAALNNFRSDLDSTEGSVQGNYIGAEESLRKNQAGLDYVSNLIEDLGSKENKTYDSLAAFSAATNQSINQKRKALAELNKAKAVDSLDAVKTQYYNPFTGQLESGNESTIDSDDIRKRADADKSMIALYDIKEALKGDNGLAEATETVQGDKWYMNKLSDKDTRMNKRSLLSQTKDQINRVRTTMEEGYKRELQARQDNAAAFAASSEASSLEAIEKQKKTAASFAAEQEREIRESIETDKRNLSRASSSNNAGKKRSVRIQGGVDDQRPM